MTFQIAPKSDSIERVLQLTHILTTPYNENMDKLLDSLCTFGFERSRYYEVTGNSPVNDELLTLSATAGMLDEDKQLIGYKIHLRHSTLGNSGDITRPAVGHYNDRLPPDERQWADRLGLKGRSWVDIPVLAAGHLIGILALDWAGESEDLSTEDQAFLLLVASRLGMGLSGLSIRLMNTAQASFANTNLMTNPEHVVGSALRKITETLNASVGAVFIYDWKTDTLMKIDEFCNPSLNNPLPPAFEETYANGECLTGHVWDNPEYRHIVDFEALITAKPTLIATPSLDRHTALIKHPVITIMYGILGKRERRFLLRLINRVDAPKLPFVVYHKEAFGLFCRELSEAIDLHTASRRLIRLQSVSKTLLTSLTDPHRSFREIQKGLSDDGVNSFAILCRPIAGNALSIQFLHGDVFSAWLNNEEQKISHDAQSLFQHLEKISEPTVIDLRKVARTCNDPFLNMFRQSDIDYVIVFPIDSSYTTGLLIIPIPPATRRGRRFSIAAIREYSQQAYDNLLAYASIMGSCIDAAESHSSVEGALRLVGFIGHEVEIPSTILGHTAMEATRRAIRSIPGTSPSEVQLQEQLRGWRNRAENEMLHIGKIMELAKMVVPQIGVRLQLNFRRCNMNNLLLDAIKAVRRLPPPVDQQGKERDYHITLGAGCEKLGDLICDSNLLTHVFTNLLGNAVKYSLPRHKGRAMEIRITGMPQTGMSIVQITNWGLGIPPEEQEKIFNPFSRGYVLDRYKAIRGMGLGLYLARRIMTAHEGSVQLHHSVFTLDDPTRRDHWEGFETTFEVRLPHVLSEGVHEHVWEKES